MTPSNPIRPSGRLTHLVLAACLLALFAPLPAARAQTPPSVRIVDGASQFLVHGQTFLMLAGELGNSSAGTAAEADAILPRLAQLHVNTVLMPVPWDEIEPTEGRFDFSILDHWIAVARRQQLHLVLLWFGSWKNAFSEYAPAWVLADPARFPREISAEGLPTQILSPFGEQTAAADSRAFAALLAHLHSEDAADQTVLMIQVENEIGFLGLGGRDRSPQANRLFAGPVPPQLVQALAAHRDRLPHALAAQFNPDGAHWHAVFGDAADEAFMAWFYGRFVEQVAAAGKKQYPLPLYMNAQLPAPFERPGDYPSGAPHPIEQPIYRVAAPSIDFYAPDIYWPNFEDWVERYQAAGNAVFVPEARLDAAPFNALYAFGQARGFGFSPFDVDSLRPGDPPATPDPLLADEYGALGQMSSLILEAQQQNRIRALVLHETSLRPTQTVALGGFLFRATLARGWPSHTLSEKDGALMVLEAAPDTFYVLGTGLSVTVTRDPDTDNQLAGIASFEEGSFADGRFTPSRVLNGDQSDQGRRLLLNPRAFHVYRVRLYTAPRP